MTNGKKEKGRSESFSSFSAALARRTSARIGSGIRPISISSRSTELRFRFVGFGSPTLGPRRLTLTHRHCPQSQYPCPAHTSLLPGATQSSVPEGHWQPPPSHPSRQLQTPHSHVPLPPHSIPSV